MKQKWNYFIFVEWRNEGWLVKLIASSIKNQRFLYCGINGYMFSSSINPINLLFLHSLSCLLKEEINFTFLYWFIEFGWLSAPLALTKSTKEVEMEWNYWFHGMDCFRGDGPPAYNPPIHKSNASRSLIDFINKLIPPINSLCLICEIVGREKQESILTVPRFGK